MSKNIILFIRRNRLFNRLISGFVFLYLTVAFILPLFSGMVEAAQITSRSLTLGTAQPSVATTYTFTFTVPTTGTVIKSFSAQACTTSVGTCTTPTGFSVTGSTLPSQPTGLGAASGWTVNTATAGQLRLLDASNATTVTNPITIFFGNVTNSSTTNTAFYMRMTTYSDAAWTTAVDTGTTASAIVQTLTINAAVAEILNFCIGSTTVDNGTGALPANCIGVSGVSVNLGTLDSGHINVTPVSTNCSAGDCSKNGLAMIQSNAVNGSAIYYDSIQQSGTNHLGTLRISGATCTNDTVNASVDQTDSCFNERPAGATFTAGTERYGMTVAAVNCSSVGAYSCTFAGGTYHMVRTSNYNSTGSNTYTTDSNTITGTSNSTYAWDESGTAVQLASSTNQVDNEGLILKFAATPAITTPFGAYTAKADFIAVSTY